MSVKEKGGPENVIQKTTSQVFIIWIVAIMN